MYKAARADILQVNHKKKKGFMQYSFSALNDTCYACFLPSSISVVSSFTTLPLEVPLSALEVALVVRFGDGAVLVASILRFWAML